MENIEKKRFYLNEIGKMTLPSSAKLFTSGSRKSINRIANDIRRKRKKCKNIVVSGAGHQGVEISRGEGLLARCVNRILGKYMPKLDSTKK